MRANIPTANAETTRKRITILGAGVVGQVFAARLADAGHDVSLIARGQTLESLRKDGVRVRRLNETARSAPVQIVDVEQAQTLATEVLLVCVRREQLTAASSQIRSLPFEQVILLQNAGARVPVSLNFDRPLVRAFPGIGGEFDPSGMVHYIEIAAQPTTFAAEDDPWAATHDVMMAAFGAAIVSHGGDSVALAYDTTGHAHYHRCNS